MRVYFDASALVSLATAEKTSAALVEWRLAHDLDRAFYSDFGRGEVAAAIAKLIRMGRAANTAIIGGLEYLEYGLPDFAVVTIEPPDVARATEFIMRTELGLRLPDAIHVAVASRLGAALVTLDKQQHDAAIALGVAVSGPLNT